MTRLRQRLYGILLSLTATWEILAGDLYNPVSTFNPLLSPLIVIQSRSKLQCVASCEIFEKCIAVQYNHITFECVLMYLPEATECSKTWKARKGRKTVKIRRKGSLVGEVLVFRCSAGTGQRFYEPWITNSYNSSCNREMFNFYKKTEFTYKHPALRQWKMIQTLKVRLSLLKNGTEVVRLVFNGTGTTNMDWFSHSRILESSFTDLMTKNAVVSLEGFAETRRFYIRKTHLLCQFDSGWMSLTEKYLDCDWEAKTSFPAFMYSTSGEEVTWAYSKSDVGLADDLVIYITAEV